jgi:hypothetical protein
VYKIKNFGTMASATETNTRTSSSNWEVGGNEVSSRQSPHPEVHVLTDLATRGDFDAFEPFIGMFTSHNKIALYGEESEDVANLSALDGSK